MARFLRHSKLGALLNVLTQQRRERMQYYIHMSNEMCIHVRLLIIDLNKITKVVHVTRCSPNDIKLSY